MLPNRTLAGWLAGWRGGNRFSCSGSWFDGGFIFAQDVLAPP